MRKLFTLFFLAAATNVFAAFTYYSPATINHLKCGASDSSNFPVLVNVTDNRFKTVANGGHVQNSSGFDIRPYSDLGVTAITGYELERYNATTGEVVMWVKIATVSHTVDTTFYLYYGNSSLTTDGSSTTTWSNSFTSVYHLKDGTTLNVNDATGTNNGTNHSATATAGAIDGAANTASASSQYISCGSFGTTAAMTFSCWVNATSFPNSYNSPMTQNGVAGVYFSLMVNSSGKLACYVKPTADVHYDGTGSHTLSSGTTYYLSMTYNSSAGLIGYVNAASDGTGAANGAMSISSVNFDIGQDPQNAGRFWNGVIDEARISSVARSADWITTEYNNGNSPSTFDPLGTEVAVGGANTNLFFNFLNR